MRELYEKYQGYLPAAFFLGGFLFDVLTLARIDQSFSLLTQAGYLIIITTLLFWEINTPRAFVTEGKWLAKVWPWHVEVLHFLFGALLSLYTLFYFKSSSSLNSFLFMVALAGVLVINEFPFFQKRGVIIRASLLSLCLISYFIYLVPVITGSIGVLSFILALALSTALFLLFASLVRQVKSDDWVLKRIVLPGVMVPILFTGLYVFRVLPPVPVSLTHIGIYHEVEKQGDGYWVRYSRDWWRFWQSGAQTFVRQEGDKVFCFLSIFSPTKFSDQVTLNWYLWTKNQWQQSDRIPMTIRGGRDRGYRGFSYKENVQEGHWQVRVMTSDGREVGRISFEVIDGHNGAARDLKQKLY